VPFVSQDERNSVHSLDPCSHNVDYSPNFDFDDSLADALYDEGSEYCLAGVDRVDSRCEDGEVDGGHLGRRTLVGCTRSRHKALWGSFRRRSRRSESRRSASGEPFRGKG
jgi:hypothetical protein